MPVEDASSHEEPATNTSSELKQKLFLICITDWVFALLVFYFCFHLPSQGLHYLSNNVDTAGLHIALQASRMIIIIVGSIWCCAFVLKYTLNSLQKSLG